MLDDPRQRWAPATERPAPDFAGNLDLLQAVFDAAGNGLCLVDAAGRVLRANGAWLRSAGLPAGQQVLGCRLWELLPQTPAALRLLHDDARGGKPVDLPARAVLLDGEEAWYESRLTPVALPDGGGLLISARDISRDVAESRRAREALHAHARQMANFFRVVQAGIVVTRLDDQTIIDVNEEWLRLVGRQRDEVIGRTTAALGVFASPESRRGFFAELETTGSIRPAEARIRRKDGSAAVCLISAGTATISGENCLSVWQDVTALNETTAALRGSEARYRLLFENSPLPKWLYDTETLRFLAVNDAAVLLYGYAREEFLQMTLEQLEASPGVEAARAARRPPVADGLCWHRKKDGTRVAVELRGHSFLADERNTRLVVAQDVTERQEAEAAVRASEAKFDALSRSSIIGLVTSAGGRLLEANDAFLRMLGYAAEDLEGGQLRWDLLTPSGWAQSGAVISAQIEEQGFAGPIEKEYLRKDGTRAPVIVGVAPLDAEARITWVLDISDRKRLERVQRAALELAAENQRIQESSRLKSEFLANMSHELRTPLNAIIGFSALLHEEEVPEGERRGYAGHILGSARHLLGLINDVLDLVKVEAGRMEFRPEELSCAALVREVVGLMEPLAAAKHIDLAVFIEPALPDGLFLDPARLKQVLLNYLSNAIKFTGEGGNIAVRMLCEEGDRLRLEVEDDGPGIDAADLGRLFVEFQQLDSGANRRHEGTGLGLALSRQLVEAQGGSVGVRSERGLGSVFHAVLPRRAAQPPA